MCYLEAEIVVTSNIPENGTYHGSSYPNYREEPEVGKTEPGVELVGVKVTWNVTRTRLN